MLYSVRKEDITQAGKVLADAFHDDPLWKKIFEGYSDLDKRFRSMAELSIKHGLKYGKVLATSENLEGIISWVPAKYADMSVWQLISGGNTGRAFRMGFRAIRRMGQAMKQIPKDRHEHMAGRDHLYLLIIGVTPELQGKGYGKQLLEAVIKESDRTGLPVYLDVQVEDNVYMYEHFGCELINKVTLPLFDIPIWEMIREPGG